MASTSSVPEAFGAALRQEQVSRETDFVTREEQGDWVFWLTRRRLFERGWSPKLTVATSGRINGRVAVRSLSSR